MSEYEIGECSNCTFEDSFMFKVDDRWYCNRCSYSEEK